MIRFASCTLIAFASTLAGCRTNSSAKGEVASGVYAAPLGNLRFPVPALGPGQRMQDGIKHSPDGEYHIGYVMFFDEQGHLSSVTYENLPPEWIDRQNDAATMRKVNTLLFDTVVLKPTNANMPGAEVSHAHTIDDADGTQYFAVLDIPGGSVVAAKSAGSGAPARPLDAQRAYLVFTEKGWSYVLCMVTDPTGHTRGKDVNEEQVEQWHEQLRAFRHTLELATPVGQAAPAPTARLPERPQIY